MILRVTRWFGFVGLVGGIAATAGCNSSSGSQPVVANGGGSSTQLGGSSATSNAATSTAGGSTGTSKSSVLTTSGGTNGATATSGTNSAVGGNAMGGNDTTDKSSSSARGGAALGGGSNLSSSSLGGAASGGNSTRISSTTSTAAGGSTATGNSTAGVNAAGNAAAGTTGVVGPGSYAVNPPNQCTNRFSIQDCRKGVASSACGGVCTNDYGGGAQNACEGGKSGVPINFACPRFLLFSDEFIQAAIDDGFGGVFNYGIVGHDVDTGGVDGTNTNACCQCYQFIFDYPNENQCWVDPGASSNPKSALTPPKAMIVQSFNTAAGGPRNFDIYMGAGGLGANNGCFSISGSSSPSGQYLYTGYPSAGQPGDGGVKPAGNWGNQTACKTSTNWVTEASLGSAECVAKVSTACNQIQAKDAKQQAAAIRSCIQSNDPQSDYHLNWYVWVKRIECPAHLTEVTGCKLAPQGLPTADPNVTTVAQAKSAGFRQKDANNEQYTNTTMEDCCMPTCAWADNVKAPTVGNYNSFYSCNQSGVPQTQP